MIIENSFEVALAPDRALKALTDVPAIAPCIPGVSLEETLADGSYRGKATVRLGPVALAFAGTARIVSVDEAARSARVAAEGADQKGRGQARADVTFALSPSERGTRVDVTSDITLSGQVAQYGRASGLIKEVANQIIGAFVSNLEARLAAEPAGAAAASAPAAQDAAGTQPSAAGGASPAPREISGLTLIFRALVAWIGGLIRGRAA